MPDSASDTSKINRPKQALYASLGMLALAGITAIGVVAYFVRNADPWTWRGLVALATIPFALVCAGLIYRAPTRENAGAALLVVAFSIVRVGFPGEWTNASWILLVLTAACAAPVVWAARTLPQ